MLLLQLLSMQPLPASIPCAPTGSGSWPTLIITGRYDAGVGRRMADELPDAEVRTFKNSTHVVMWEEPEAYFETLLAFLDANRS